MANVKKGFQYFSIETDRYQDMKIKRLKKALGPNGVAVYDYILCEIYRVEGSFLVWDESTVFDVADYWGLNESTVKEIVNYCCSVGLFSKALLVRESVLTSESIQKRYLRWSGIAKRVGYSIPDRIRILPEESIKLQEESANIPEESPDTSGSLPQSKVKKSKVKKSKEGETADACPSPPVDDELFKNFLTWIEKNAPKVSKLKEPFTQEQYRKLRQRFTQKALTDVLTSMHNRATLLKDYTSAYLTCRNWLERRAKDGEKVYNHESTESKQSKAQIIGQQISGGSEPV